ncbi:MFS transporter [Thalassospira sp.]|uniref:MFS transporter n=1 Tax=Thalassospira sp. TaxID=1912094 RepID=UPI002733E5E2|nr:MFS transporter [Thalassospira sp.]MDP2699461.1 MFS transporter [Thalassospira sp.]
MRPDSLSVLFYALPAVAAAIPTIPAYVLLPGFYGDTLGVGLAVTGAVLLAVRLIDVVTDPLIGWISDRSGRRKIWVVLGAIIAGVGLWHLFSPPDDPDGLYLFVWASVLFLGWTLFQIPYLAWGAELSGDYRQRSAITAWREGCGLIGILMAGAIPVMMMIDDRGAEIRMIGLVTVIAGAITIGLLAWKVPDPHHLKHLSGISPARLPDFRSLMRNRLFVRLLSAWWVNGLANGLPAVCFPLFVRYYLQLDSAAENILILLYFAVAILAIPVWVVMAGRFGKHRVWCGAMIMAIAAFVFVPLLGPGDMAAFAVICVVTGAALGADLALPPAIQADVDDWDRYRFGGDRTALLFALWNMANKLAMGLAVGIAFPVLGALGLTTDITPTSTALIVLILIYAVIPVVLKTMVIVMMWRFPIDASHQNAIRRRLSRRTVTLQGAS